jgi:prepilin-type N-terminal cleavage/methylation domain-containing protein
MRATKSSVFNSRLKRVDAGFTLIELMIVVVIMGVLAGLASYGVRKYLLEAKRGEAIGLLTQIRAAEEAYKDERFVYLGGDDFETWHPTDDPGGKKFGWGFGDNAMSRVFAELGVVSDGPVEYAYAVVAGTVGSSIPSIPMTINPAFSAPTGPFYIAMAKADLNDDGLYTYAIAHSDTNTIAVDDKY